VLTARHWEYHHDTPRTTCLGASARTQKGVRLERLRPGRRQRQRLYRRQITPFHENRLHNSTAKWVFGSFCALFFCPDALKRGHPSPRVPLRQSRRRTLGEIRFLPGLVALCQQRTLGLEQRPQGIGRLNGIFLRTHGLQAVQDTDPHSVWVSFNTFPHEVCCRVDRPEGKRVTFSRQSNADFGLDREVVHENTNVA
jgi:hypothetical protein